MQSEGNSEQPIRFCTPSHCHSICNGSTGPSASSPKISNRSPGKFPTMSTEFVKLNWATNARGRPDGAHGQGAFRDR